MKKKRAGRNTGRQSKTFGKSKGSRPAVRNVIKAEAASWLRWLSKRFLFLIDALQVRQCVSLALRRCMGSGFSPGEGEAIAAAAVVVVVFACLGSWSTIYGYGVETLANTDDNPKTRPNDVTRFP
jgi:hypothetical protein